MRKTQDERKVHMLEVGATVAQEKGFFTMTAQDIADACGVARPLLNKHFSNINNYRGELVKHIIKTEQLDLVLQLLVGHNEGFKNMVPSRLRSEAIKQLTAI